MTLDTDFHNHVSRSSARQMAQSAQERGLRVLGLSEHIFQMNEARSPLAHMPLEGPMLSFAKYIAEVQAAGKDLQVEVRLGLEVDFIPEKQECIQASIQEAPWDYLIGSVHEVDGMQFEFAEKLTREEGMQFWLRYFQLLREAVRSGYFSIVSHPVRMRAANPFLPPTLDDELEELAAEATKQNVALEINGYDMLHYPSLVQHLAKACALHQTPISVNSDAHNPRQIAQAHQPSEALLREVGINKVRIWKHRIPEEYCI
jgi:histidinol-phosphatase (PHP family)